MYTSTRNTQMPVYKTTKHKCKYKRHKIKYSSNPQPSINHHSPSTNLNNHPPINPPNRLFQSPPLRPRHRLLQIAIPKNRKNRHLAHAQLLCNIAGRIRVVFVELSFGETLDEF